MSTTHGFRIYVVQAFENQISGRQPEDVSIGSAAYSSIIENLDQLHHEGTRFLEPRRLPPPGEPQPPIATITLGEPAMVRSDLIHVEVAIGEQGLHRKATRQNRPAKDLAKWSAEADHYVTFLFPTHGDAFIVVAQSIRRRDPIGLLFRLMTTKGIELKKAAKAAEDADRESAVARGDKPPKRVAHARLLFSRHQAADNSYIDDIISSAKSATATFQSKVPSDRGRAADTVRRTLHIKLLDDQDREIGRTISRRWQGRRRRGEVSSQRDGVSELGALLEEQDLLEEGEAEHYDTASVAVRSTSGATTTIAVDTLRDVFTYPVSDGQPQPYFYYSKVAPRLKSVAAEEIIDILEIDPLEVEQCLDASTSGRS